MRSDVELGAAAAGTVVVAGPANIATGMPLRTGHRYTQPIELNPTTSLPSKYGKIYMP